MFEVLLLGTDINICLLISLQNFFLYYLVHLHLWHIICFPTFLSSSTSSLYLVKFLSLSDYEFTFCYYHFIHSLSLSLGEQTNFYSLSLLQIPNPLLSVIRTKVEKTMRWRASSCQKGKTCIQKFPRFYKKDIKTCGVIFFIDEGKAFVHL